MTKLLHKLRQILYQDLSYLPNRVGLLLKELSASVFVILGQVLESLIMKNNHPLSQQSIWYKILTKLLKSLKQDSVSLLTLVGHLAEYNGSKYNRSCRTKNLEGSRFNIVRFRTTRALSSSPTSKRVTKIERILLRATLKAISCDLRLIGGNSCSW